MQLVPPVTTYVCTRPRLDVFIYVLALGMLISQACGYDTNEIDNYSPSDLQKLWDTYLLRQFKADIERSLEEQPAANIPIGSERSISDSMEDRGIRQKRYGLAGLENLDLLTKTLRQGSRGSGGHGPMMSVGGMNLSRMRQLMANAGRRK